MKTTNITKVSIVAILLVAFATGCKKYGYKFADGFPDAGADSSTITVDTSMSVPDYSMYAQATIFPGVVGDDAPRLKNYPITVDLDYIKNPNQLRISVLPKAWLSTGLYAPTGEPIAIDVPANVFGLTAQIGCWTDNLTSKAGTEPDKMKREPVLFTVKQLFPGRNYIRSPFGGPIYIISPFATGGSVTLNVSGACKMPDFVLGKTDVNEWKEELKNSKVPWFELRAPHIIFTLETEKAKRIGIDKPELLMQTWEDIFNKDYSEWEGLSDNPADPIDQAAGLPWRVVADIQPSVGYGHSGYPVVIQDDDHWFIALSDIDKILQGGSWGILHEVGHNNQQSNWSLSNMGETTNNLFSFKVANRLHYRLFSDGGGGWNRNITQGMAFAADPDPSKDWFTDDRIENCFVPFVQIFENYGYDFMTVLYSRTRRAIRTSNNDQDRIDFMYDALCDYTQTNMLPFFDAWGWRVSKQQKEIEEDKGYPYLNKKVWLYDMITDTGGDEPFTYVPPLTDTVDRSNWLVLNYDSQHSPYVIEKMFDGDAGSFWNTEYSGSKPPYPHYFTVDMTVTQKIRAFSFLGRANNQYSQNPSKVNIYIGDSPTTLTKVVDGASLELLGTTNVYLPVPKKCRYFKIEFTEGGNSSQPVMNEAEVNAYR